MNVNVNGLTPMTLPGFDRLDQPPAALREAAGRVVGSVFYGTLLRQMRASGLKGEYGHGGRGEEVFQAQMDQIFAEEAGRAGRSNLVDAIVERLARQQSALDRRAEIDGGRS